MLSPAENKVVNAILTKRKVWLNKALEDRSLDAGVREEHLADLKLLDSSIKKLSKLSGNGDASPAIKESLAKKLAQSAPRILVAEDNAESADLMIELLKDLGYGQVDLAKDGVEAFSMIKSAKEPYQIILCDWDMPELNGLDLLSKAKASNTLRGAHFMMVTAVTEAAKIRSAIQQGVKDYIVKPIDASILEGKINTALEAAKNAS